MTAPPYLTPAQFLDAVGESRLRSWTDKATNQSTFELLTQEAIDAASGRIDGALQAVYAVPIDTGAITDATLRARCAAVLRRRCIDGAVDELENLLDIRAGGKGTSSSAAGERLLAWLSRVRGRAGLDTAGQVVYVGAPEDLPGVQRL